MLVALFAVMYALILMLDYGYFNAEAVLVHSFFIGRMRKLFPV